MQASRSELEAALDEAEWHWLIPHAQRDSIIVVAAKLDLVDVGLAISNDNVTSVQQWISDNLISKPSPDQLSEWNQEQNKRFQALIVQPYVLIQEAAAA